LPVFDTVQPPDSKVLEARAAKPTMWVLLRTSSGTRAAGTVAVGVGVGVAVATELGDSDGEVDGDVGGTILIVPPVPDLLGDAVELDAEGLADADEWLALATGAGFFDSPRHFRTAMTPAATITAPKTETSSRSRLLRSARRWLPGGLGASSSLTW
jgi:hypothetical protein